MNSINDTVSYILKNAHCAFLKNEPPFADTLFLQIEIMKRNV